MPFTFAHPVLIAPLCGKKAGRYFSATGLIIGAMVLDFQFFFYMRKINFPSMHRAEGVWIFGLPMALLLAYSFHNWVKAPLIQNLPEAWRQRLWPYMELRFQHLLQRPLVFIFSILVGIYSHLFLDAFTHADGFIVAYLSLLAQPLDLFGRNLYVYDLLQLLFSVLGLVWITIFFLRMPKYETEAVRGELRSIYWLWYLFTLLLIGTARFLLDPEHLAAIDLLIGGIGCATYALALHSVLWRILLSSSGRQNRRVDEFV